MSEVERDMSAATRGIVCAHPHRFCMAPMMDCTDRHDRFLMRLMSRNMWLYTEMVVAAAIIHGDTERFLRRDPSETPVALQLGGSHPRQMAEAADLGQSAGFNEINMNVGCPSDRVKSGQFGACLMLQPELVGDCVAAMTEAVDIPITVKCRIGVDDHDSYDELIRFVEIVHAAGCNSLFVHARKAWLSGLSPKQNREIPPLHYDRVFRLKRDFPGLEIVLNGGIQTLEQCKDVLKEVDGVMVGRSAYSDPYAFAAIDRVLFGSSEPSRSRGQLLDDYIEYIEENLEQGVYLKHMSRHLLGLYHAMPGARSWRRALTEGAMNRNATVEVIKRAREFVDPACDIEADHQPQQSAAVGLSDLASA